MMLQCVVDVDNVDDFIVTYIIPYTCLTTIKATVCEPNKGHFRGLFYPHISPMALFGPKGYTYDLVQIMASVSGFETMFLHSTIAAGGRLASAN